MRVASIQVKANDLLDYEKAWKRLEQHIREAIPAHDLILVPECALPAYFLGDDGDLPSALSFGEHTLMKIKEMAREGNSYIAYGYAEREGDYLYNTAVLIDRSGNEVVKKRKSYLWHFDYKWFAEGDDLAVADTDFGRVGLVVCADARMPEIVRIAALEGADLIIDLANLTATGPDIGALQNAQSAYMLSVRALENQVWLAVSDKWGVESNSITYAGRSGVYAPDGSCAYQAGSDRDEIVSVEIPTDSNGKIVREFSAAAIGRRPELYSVLVQPTETLPITAIIEEQVAPSSITPFITVAAGDFKETDEDDYLNMVRRLVSQDSKLICMPPSCFSIIENVDKLQSLLPADTILAATTQNGPEAMTTFLIADSGIEFVYRTLHDGTMKAAGHPSTWVYQAKWGRIGILHDREALLPEWSKTLMLLGADCLIWPNRQIAPAIATSLTRTRAAENRIYIVSAQAAGETNGISQIIDPSGMVTASTLQSERQHACGAYTPFANSRVKEIVPGTHIVKNRHPQSYGRLTK